jgi:hypothetical protein
MTTAIRIRACHVGILGIAKIGTSNLRRIVLPFSHQALTPLRSPSAKQRVNQPFAGSPHSSVLPGSSAGIRNANRLVRPELPIDCVEFLRFTRSFVPESTLFTVYVRSFQLNRSAVIPPNHLWTSGRWPDQSIQGRLPLPIRLRIHGCALARTRKSRSRIDARWLLFSTEATAG